jgi:restriction system protein
MADNHVFWGFHIFAQGDPLVMRGYVALGWPEAGDLSTLAPNRDAFRAKVMEAYGNVSHVTNSTGQLFRFSHEMKIGDHVIYRSKVDKQIHIGIVTGPYAHRPDLDAEYCQVRPLKWLKHLPATKFSQGALYELGSALTLFQVKNYASEFEAALEGKEANSVNEQSGGDDTVGIVAEEIEQTTEDFILKELERQYKGHPLQDFVANLLQTMGYRTRVNPKGADGGTDIIAHRDELQLEPPIIRVQVKSSPGSVSNQDVQALSGILGKGEYGLLVTLGSFTPQAKDFAKHRPEVRLIDGRDLVKLVLEHYEALDPRYKARLPLKRVYIPQPAEQESEQGLKNKAATGN